VQVLFDMFFCYKSLALETPTTKKGKLEFDLDYKRHNVDFEMLGLRVPILQKL
jgi:hypothetical protein